MPDDAQVDPGETIEALRREPAARTAECDEAPAQQAAISEMLQIVNGSPGRVGGEPTAGHTRPLDGGGPG